MEVEAAARRYLLSDATVTGYVGHRVFRDKLLEPLQPGQMAVVIWRDGGWGAPDPGNTQEYPFLIIDCYADPDRDERGLFTTSNAGTKALGLYRAVDPLFQGPRAPKSDLVGAFGSNPGLLVLSSQRWSEPFKRSAGDLHPGQSEREGLGDAEVVRTRYAWQVVH